MGVEEEKEGKLCALRRLAREDLLFRRLERRYLDLEEAFAQMANTLPQDQQDTAWAYVCASDDLDRRLLEIACEYIRLRE